MKRKINKKGFTLIEIIGVVILIGLVALVSVPLVSKMLNRNRLDYYENLEDSVRLAARDFFVDNANYRPNGILKSQIVTATTLIGQNNIEEIMDYKGHTCVNEADDSYVVVIKTGEDEFEYGVCLKCANDKYYSNPDSKYCDAAWLNNEYIEYGADIPNNNIYVYLNTQKELLRRKLMTKTKVIKKDADGNILSAVVLNESTEDGVLPNNINEVDTTKLGTTKLYYTIASNEYEAQVTVYEHNSPKVTMKDSKNNNYDGSTWTNKVNITLEVNDEYFEKANIKVLKYQIYKDWVWQDIVCDTFEHNTCKFAIEENYVGGVKFRIINSEEFISRESASYNLKIDKDKPIISINPNGGEYLLSCSHEAGVIPIEENITVDDSGNSGLNYVKYGLSTTNEGEVLVWANADISSSQNVTISPSGGSWYLQVEAGDNASNVSTFVSNLINVKIEVKLYNQGNITFIQAMYNQDLPSLVSVPTKIGYKFQGYFSEENGNGTKYYDQYGNSAHVWDKQHCVTLYAYFTPESYTVTYNANGGSGTVSPTTCYIDSPCTIAENKFTNGDFNFVKWSNKQDGTGDEFRPGEAHTNLGTASSTVVLYAIWDGKVEVTFDKNGGESISQNNKIVDYDKEYGTLPTGYKLGHVLSGWYTEPTNGEEIKSSTKVTNKYDHTLYAKWVPRTCTVKYNSNGGSGSIQNQTCTYGTSCSLDSGNGFTRATHRLLGWSTLSSATTALYNKGASTSNICGDKDEVTLYAIWEYIDAPTCNLTLEGTGGTNGWYISNVNASLSIGGNYTSRIFKVGGQDVSGSSKNITNEGVTSVYAKVCEEDSCSVCAEDVWIDKTKPIVSLTGSGLTYKKSHTLNVSYKDEGGSGIDNDNYTYKYYISTDPSVPAGGSWQNYSSTVTINSGTGDRYVFFNKVYDKAGNTSTTSSYHISDLFKLDNSGPVIEAFTYLDKVITATAYDSHSGMVAYKFIGPDFEASDWTTIDNTTSKVTKSLNVSTAGTYYFYAKDALGNESFKELVIDYIAPDDMETPTCALQFSQISLYGNNWYNTNGTVSFSSMWDDIGITKSYISTSNNASSGPSTISLTEDQELTTYYGFVEDASGKKGTCEITVGIDKEKPSITVNPDGGTYLLTCSHTEGVVTIDEAITILVGTSDILYTRYGLSSRRDKDALDYSNASTSGYQTVQVKPGAGNWYLKVETQDQAANTSYFTSNLMNVMIEVLLDNEGTISKIQTNYNGVLPNVSVPVKTGYKFMGYYTERNGGGTKYYNADGSAAKVWDKTTCATLYAYFVADTYVVEYDANGGTGTMQSTTCYIDSPCILAYNEFTNGDLQFNGWQHLSTTYMEGGEYVNLTTASKTFTLYAIWNSELTVTFDKNGGDSISRTSKKVYYGSNYSTLPTGTRLGHLFNGWYTSSTGGSQVTETTIVTNNYNHTLYAGWSPRTCTVKYDANGGTGTHNSHTCTYDQDCTLASGNNLTRNTYNFLGWSRVSNATSVGYEGSAKTKNICGDDDEVTLYAVWGSKDIPTCNITANGTLGNNGWYTDDTISTMIITGEYLSKTFKKGNTEVNNLSTTVDANGITSMFGEVCNSAGCNYCDLDIMIDKLKPTVTFVGDGSQWAKSHTLNIQYADEGGSGLAMQDYLYYISTSSQDAVGGHAIPYVGPESIGTAITGERYIFFSDISDNAGNTSGIKTSGVYRFDNSAPSIDSLTDENGVITVKATDSHSGITKYMFRGNVVSGSDNWISVNATTSQVTLTYDVKETGTYTFYVRDAVGNESSKVITVNSLPVSDVTAPTCTLKFNQTSYYGNDWYNKSGIVSFASKNDNVAVTSSYITTTKNATSGSSQISLTKEQAITTYYGYVKDTAGNKGECKIQVGIDWTVPTLSINEYKLCHHSAYDNTNCKAFSSSPAYTYEKVVNTYQTKYTLSDNLSGIRNFQQRYNIDTYTSATQFSSLLSGTRDLSGVSGCKLESGKYVCSRTSLWNCQTEYDSSLAGGTNPKGYPRLGEIYKFKVGAVDNAGNHSVINSEGIYYQNAHQEANC